MTIPIRSAVPSFPVYFADSGSKRFTALSPSSSLVAIGTTDNKVSFLRFPSLEPAVPTLSVDDELVDLDWGGEDGEWVYHSPFSRECELMETPASYHDHDITAPVPSYPWREGRA